MYVYVDESGSIDAKAPPELTPSRTLDIEDYINRRFFVMTALVLRDKRSKRVFAHAVKKLLASWPGPPPRELKGKRLAKKNSCGLRLRRKFIKQLIRRRSQFCCYSVFVDKSKARGKPRSYRSPARAEMAIERRYAQVARNLLLGIEGIKEAPWISMVVDSRSKLKTYSWRRRPVGKTGQRAKERQLGRLFKQVIGVLFHKDSLRHFVPLSVRFHQSQQNPILQATDVLNYLCFEWKNLELSRDLPHEPIRSTLEQKTPPEHTTIGGGTLKPTERDGESKDEAFEPAPFSDSEEYTRKLREWETCVQLLGERRLIKDLTYPFSKSAQSGTWEPLADRSRGYMRPLRRSRGRLTKRGRGRA